MTHPRSQGVWQSAFGPLRPFVLSAGASQGRRVAEGGGQPAASVHWAEPTCARQAQTVLRTVCVRALSPDAILTAGVSSFTCGSRLPAALGPVPAERADTRACATDAVKVAERQDGLACSAQVKEEAAAEGRRRGTRSRARQLGLALPRRTARAGTACRAALKPPGSGHPRTAAMGRKQTPRASPISMAKGSGET